jgi:hypothetical protein
VIYEQIVVNKPLKGEPADTVEHRLVPDLITNVGREGDWPDTGSCLAAGNAL